MAFMVCFYNEHRNWSRPVRYRYHPTLLGNSKDGQVLFSQASLPSQACDERTFSLSSSPTLLRLMYDGDRFKCIHRHLDWCPGSCFCAFSNCGMASRKGRARVTQVVRGGLSRLLQKKVAHHPLNLLNEGWN